MPVDVVMAVVVMMVMVVVVMVFSLLHAAYLHPEMGAGDAALDALFGGDGDAGDGQAIHPVNKVLGLGQKLQKGGGQHISGGTHAAVQIQCGHFVPPMWLMRLARKPAPKPLSMFTTLTPLAQELSMLSRADTPPKEAP